MEVQGGGVSKENKVMEVQQSADDALAVSALRLHLPPVGQRLSQHRSTLPPLVLITAFHWWEYTEQFLV